MSSSKLRNSTSDEESECALDMSPMIDMVFLLLIFFIVNATAIIVKTDPDVAPPIADNALPQKDGSGRIVVNIRGGDQAGTFTAEDFNTILPDDVAIEDMVKKQKARNDQLGVTSKLHLRGDQETVFRYSRTVIRAAARAGVKEVVFAVYVKDPKPKTATK
jgi:biopolymer transport protein ExbD